MKKEELLQLEAQAHMQPKSLSCLVASVLFLPPFSLGVYYWFRGEILFNYEVVSPFSGFFIFCSFAILITYLASFMVKRKWKDYNAKIDVAKQEIVRLIDSEELAPEDLFRLKRCYIEERIRRDEITRDEFSWHSNRICWGCGKLHTEEKCDYRYVRTRNVSWKKGAVRYSATKEQVADIKLCPTCYKTAVEADRSIKHDVENLKKIKFIVSVIIFIVVVVAAIVDGAKIIDCLTLMLGLILALCFPLTQLLISLAIALIDLMIGGLFKKNNTKAFSPVYNFDRIPVIRSFLNRDFHK